MSFGWLNYHLHNFVDAWPRPLENRMALCYNEPMKSIFLIFVILGLATMTCAALTQDICSFGAREDATPRDNARAIQATGDLLLRAMKLAGVITALPREQGVSLVVVGGSSVEFYTEGGYMSGDIDFCRRAPRHSIRLNA